MEEIWTLQPRFEQRTKKKVHRLLAHPRFRAAYDFLLLRAPESPATAHLGEWWTQVQGMSAEQLAAHLPPASAAAQASDAESVEPEAMPPPPRRRRRRRPKPAPSTAE
jgi:poly(A) polymerase